MVTCTLQVGHQGSMITCIMQVTNDGGFATFENEADEGEWFSTITLPDRKHARPGGRQMVLAGRSGPAPWQDDLRGTARFAREDPHQHFGRPAEAIGGGGHDREIGLPGASGTLRP